MHTMQIVQFLLNANNNIKTTATNNISGFKKLVTQNSETKSEETQLES